ncbi:MAG: LptA/OstA family protein, partial [Mycobacterium sp.]
EFTVSASKAVQFKEGGKADLHDVKIVVFGKDSSRFDRIAGDEFEFDPKSGNITATGKVAIDLAGNPEGAKKPDQSAPTPNGKPIHVESDGLVFNRDTGNAFSNGKVTFETPDATGSAVGVDYAAQTGVMNLHSLVEMAVHRPQQFHLVAERGKISKGPTTIVLDAVHLTRENQDLQSDVATFFLRDDNTVERIFAEGNVEGETRTASVTRVRSDQAELHLVGTRNQLTTALLTGHVHLETNGAQPGQADAGRALLSFGANQELKTVHADEGVRMMQNGAEGQAPEVVGKSASKAASKPANKPVGVVTGAASKAAIPHPDVFGGAQEVEITAPIVDFAVKNGNELESAVTSGPPKIVITQAASKSKTVVTAARFRATFAEKNRLNLLHGEPEAKIVSSTPGQPDQTSTSTKLDVVFAPEGGISTITQAGRLMYVSGTERAWAESGTYAAANQVLRLNGAPRVVDSGMTTTARTISFNRGTGDAVAEGEVKSTYSDLKAQPGGAMLASSDPIHVVSERMTAHRTPAVALYEGKAKLWQNSNVVEAPTIEFDRERRSLLAQATKTELVRTVLVQIDSKTGKASPIRIASGHLTYTDQERTAVYEGGVTADAEDAAGSYTRMNAKQMTVFLAKEGSAKTGGASSSGTSLRGTPLAGTPLGGAQVEKIIAQDSVVLTQPTRRAVGDRLIYTASDEKFVLSGGSPSIFDAERGKITGDSLTF